MNKDKFVRVVSNSTHVRIGEVEFMVDSIFKCAKDVLATGEDLYIAGFGKFIIEHRDEREHLMPNGTKITVPEKKIVRFRPSSSLKDEMK